MERERLTRLVQDAAAVGRDDLADLDALAQRFPWFAGAQVLRSVGVQKAGEVLSEEALRTAAAHVPSRTALFDHVHHHAAPLQRLAVVKEPPVTRTPTVVEPVPVVTSELAPRLIAEPVIVPIPKTGPTAPTDPITEEPEGITTLNEAAGPILDPVVEPVHDETTTPAAVTAVSAEEEPLPAEEGLLHEDAMEDEDPLERQIMESALSHAYDISWLDVEAAPARPERVERPTPVEIPTPQPVVPIAPIQPTGPSRFVTRYDRLSFTDWLAASNEPAPQAPPAVKPKEAIVPEAATDWLRQPEEKPQQVQPPTAPIRPVAEKKGEMDTKSLIDKFIKQQTPAAPQKAEFFTPQQAAKRSLDDKAGIVTETLARVYAKQGNLPKAIEAYRRLALKYPEKSAYFATLQKELEAQLNK